MKKIVLCSFLSFAFSFFNLNTFANKKITIVYGWSKYATLTYNKHRKEFYECMISKKNMKVLFLAVNNDYTELFWNKNTPIPVLNNSLF